MPKYAEPVNMFPYTAKHKTNNKKKQDFANMVKIMNSKRRDDSGLSGGPNLITYVLRSENFPAVVREAFAREQWPER